MIEKPPLLDQHHRRDRDDRLGHRIDAEDGVVRSSADRPDAARRGIAGRRSCRGGRSAWTAPGAFFSSICALHDRRQPLEPLGDEAHGFRRARRAGRRRSSGLASSELGSTEACRGASRRTSRRSPQLALDRACAPRGTRSPMSLFEDASPPRRAAAAAARRAPAAEDARGRLRPGAPDRPGRRADAAPRIADARLDDLLGAAGQRQDDGRPADRRVARRRLRAGLGDPFGRRGTEEDLRGGARSGARRGRARCCSSTRSIASTAPSRIPSCR